ncbi:MAG: carbohydrate kinase family protein [Ignavibacteriales bacterium]|nr:MAG: carbohydrate kinase family protein [Ignavibacteriales bacterium]
MKLLVIGQTVEDHYIKDGEEVVAPGGIYYAAAALAQLKDANDEIMLCTSIEENNYQLFADVYERYDKKYISRVDAIPKVWLTVDPHKERSERYVNITAELKTGFSCSDYDGVLVNMITGFDISIDQFQKIREELTGVLYLDVHTLSRGMDFENNRKFRIIPEFEKWARCADIIQVNEHELFCLSEFKTEMEIVSWLLDCNVRVVIITLAERGAKYFYRDRGEIASVYHSALKVEVNNKIGCGDVFGSAFFFNHLKHKDLLKALVFANTAAAFITSYNDTKQINQLKDDILRQSY